MGLFSSIRDKIFGHKRSEAAPSGGGGALGGAPVQQQQQTAAPAQIGRAHV